MRQDVPYHGAQAACQPRRLAHFPLGLRDYDFFTERTLGERCCCSQTVGFAQEIDRNATISLTQKNPTSLFKCRCV